MNKKEKWMGVTLHGYQKPVYKTPKIHTGVGYKQAMKDYSKELRLSGLPPKEVRKRLEKFKKDYWK